jgi:hypothetical protein
MAVPEDKRAQQFRGREGAPVYDVNRGQGLHRTHADFVAVHDARGHGGGLAAHGAGNEFGFGDSFG